jgi:hypothetical protein
MLELLPSIIIASTSKKTLFAAFIIKRPESTELGALTILDPLSTFPANIKVSVKSP